MCCDCSRRPFEPQRGDNSSPALAGCLQGNLGDAPGDLQLPEPVGDASPSPPSRGFLVRSTSRREPLSLRSAAAIVQAEASMTQTKVRGVIIFRGRFGRRGVLARLKQGRSTGSRLNQWLRSGGGVGYKAFIEAAVGHFASACMTAAARAQHTGIWWRIEELEVMGELAI